MDQENLLRNAFSIDVVKNTAGRIAAQFPDFDSAGFVSSVMLGFSELSFGARARKILEGLEHFLPTPFPEAAEILINSLGPEPEEDELNGLDGFYIMPYTMFVSSHGIDYPDLALDALYEMTKRFTAEGDVRPFIERYPQKTLAFLEKLTRDPSPFARRLASEGTRPRLPLYGRLKRFQHDPSPVIHLLDKLYTDHSLMVRRSVANHLNDISKDNPDVTVAVLARWKDKNPGPDLEWLIRHALRTLVKTGDPSALALLGYGAQGITVDNWKVSSASVALGESIQFSVDVSSDSETEQKLALNYIIHFVKANGKTSPKVFRLADKTVAKGEGITITKVHKFRDFRNQSFYGGEHSIELTVNGVSRARSSFFLAV